MTLTAENDAAPILPSLYMPTPAKDRTWPPTPYGVGHPLIPLATEEWDELSLNPAGYMPPQGIPVVFETFDGQQHLGETGQLATGNPTVGNRHETVFFERVGGARRGEGRRVVYFCEQVKAWQIRDDKPGWTLL